MTTKARTGMRRAVCDANVALSRRGLTPLTYGNASAIDHERGLVVIKPSGVAYDTLTPDAMVVTDLDGKVVEGKLHPSSDLPTHLALYRAFGAIGGVVHTHSHYATAWAQAAREIPCLGTTHADHFHGPVPVTATLSASETANEYEANTGHAIVRRFATLDPMTTPAVLVAGHASFAWGVTVAQAVDTMTVLEAVARLALDTLALNPAAKPISQAFLDKRYRREHGADAYSAEQR